MLANVRTGTGSTLTVTSGPNMSNKGGLCITKSRSAATGWRFVDSSRGVTKSLDSSSTAAEATESTGLTAFTSSGATFGAATDYNNSGATYLDVFLARSAKFFDIVTYTGTGSNLTLNHSLGGSPGMIIVKRTDTTSDWVVYHRTQSNCGFLNLTSTFASAQRFSSVTSTDFTINVSTADVNASGGTYVAYVFAHDTTEDGLIQCGSFTTDGSGVGVVTLGWEPQLVITKTASGTTSNWKLTDSTRGFTTTVNNPTSYLNTTSAEAGVSNFLVNAKGFSCSGEVASSTYVYVAIRRGPMRPPTSGTQVYNALARSGTGATASVTGVGFPSDLLLTRARNVSSAGSTEVVTRLLGTNGTKNRILLTASTGAEQTGGEADVASFDMDGFTFGNNTGFGYTNASGSNYIHHCFRRYPGVFDIVTYTGTGANRTVSHNLGVAPEFIIFKNRSNVTSWAVWHFGLIGSTYSLFLNSTSQQADGVGAYMASSPSSTVLNLGTGSEVNQSTSNMVAYLFATLAGITKAFSYTGNGTSQTINCGFSAGARYIMIKRTDNTGAWFIFDSIRGIVAGNDPYISFNTSGAEVTTDDSVDPDTSGFIVNQVAATNINVSSATYIGFAIA